jgi:hypothetical protein
MADDQNTIPAHQAMAAMLSGQAEPRKVGLFGRIMGQKHQQNLREDENNAKFVLETLKDVSTGKSQLPPETVDMLVGLLPKTIGKEPAAVIKQHFEQMRIKDEVDARMRMLPGHENDPPSRQQGQGQSAFNPGPTAAAQPEQPPQLTDDHKKQLIQMVMAQAQGQQGQQGGNPFQAASSPAATQGLQASPPPGIPPPPNFKGGAPAGPAPTQQPDPAAAITAGSVNGGMGFGPPSTPPPARTPQPSRGTIFSKSPAQQGVDEAAQLRPGLEVKAEMAAQEERTKSDIAVRERQLLAEQGMALGITDPDMLGDYINKHAVSQITDLGPGHVGWKRSGKPLGTGGPQINNVAPGGAIVSTPTPMPGAPGMPPQPTGAPTVTQGPPPLLTPDESLLLSAAQRVAQKHGVAFDPAKDPRNPYSQLPTNLHGEVSALHAREKADPEIRASTLAMRTSLMESRAIRDENASSQRGDRSYALHIRELDGISKPVTDRLERLIRTQDTLAQDNPTSDALIAPELMTTIAGGAGSGVRITNSEINAIQGGRTAFETLKARAGYILNNPNKGYAFTSVQRQQIKQLLGIVSGKLVAKQNAINDAYREVSTETDPTKHRTTLATTKKKLSDIDMGVQGMPTPPGKIAVKMKSDGAEGTIDEKDFNPATMEKLNAK